MGYVTFLLDLNDTGTIQWLKGSLKFRPDDQKPTNAFAWKVTRDSNGIVAVRALKNKKLVLIAHAKYMTTKLIDREQIGSEPTMYQWNSVEEALRLALHERENAAPDDDVISEPIDSSELVGMKESGPSYAQAIAQENRRERELKKRRQNDGPRVLIGLGVVIVASIGVYYGVGYGARKSRSTTTSSASSTTTESSSSTTTSSSSSSAVVTPEPPAPPPVPEDTATRVGKLVSLDDAFAAVKPDLDPQHAAAAAGVDTLANYHLRWTDVDVPSQTTLAKVEKDPSAERGKHVCTDGKIDRITKIERANRTYWSGALVTAEGDRVAFVVGGSTGELVKRDAAKLCGIVTGTVDGATHVFGMFDLPENRNPVVEKP